MALHSARTSIAIMFLVLVVTSSHAAWSQNPDENREVTVNYVYAVQLGIGGYSVDGLDVKAFSLPLAHTFGLETPKGWKLKAKAPISLGFYDFHATDTDGSDVSAYQETVSVLPGLELDIPLTEIWSLIPFGDFGIGHGLRAQRRYAYVYSGGLKNVLTIPWQKYVLSFGNSVTYAGNSTFDGDVSENYFAIRSGFDVRRELGFRLPYFPGNIEPDLGIFVIHHFYPKPLVFKRFLSPPLRVENQIEIGFSVGSSTAFEIFGIQKPRIGASYIAGDGLSVFRINFGFPI